MAGGIDWFRWHHGSVTDPKFQLVARKSKQALAPVIAVWAFVLEQASASEDRGAFGSIDCEAIDCLLGLDDGATAETCFEHARRDMPLAEARDLHLLRNFLSSAIDGGLEFLERHFNGHLDLGGLEVFDGALH